MIELAMQAGAMLAVGSLACVMTMASLAVDRFTPSIAWHDAYRHHMTVLFVEGQVQCAAQWSAAAPLQKAVQACA